MTNVLLVTIDSLRADHVGCYGYERDTTPRIDEFAEQSALFERTFAHACSTRPSFPAILTSSYPLMYGGYERLSEERTLVSEVFDRGNYRTGGFHSNAYLNPEFGYARGFDYFFDSMTDPSTTARLRQFVKLRLDRDGVLYRTLARAFFTAERQVGANIGSAYVNADEITDHAIEWLQRGTGENEFLWVHFMDVHHPYLPPAEHQRVFRDEPIDERRAMQLRRKFVEDPDDITDGELQDILDLYDAEIHFADSEIGRLLDAVEAHWENHVVAITADHGEEFTDHGGFSHSSTFYDEVVHVPFVLYDGEHGGRYDDLVGLIDLAPTLVEAAELERPENFYGHDLHRLFADDWPREAVLGDGENTSTGERRFMYRDTEWKYIRRDRGEELYYLPDDPGERENVLDAHPDVHEEQSTVVDEHERDIEQTQVDIGEVEMDDAVKARLRDLGYRE